MKYALVILLLIAFFGFTWRKNKNKSLNKEENTSNQEDYNLNQEVVSMSYEEQLAIFQSLGYVYNEGVTKKMILRDAYEMTWEDEIEKYIEENPFSILYPFFGYGDIKVPKFNYSDNCILWGLDFFDPNSQYIEFMKRMGQITNGEINFTEIELLTDSEDWEWIKFKVNGIPKKWKLQKTRYIADHYIQRFSYLPAELKTTGRYTYFEGFTIDYATEAEQKKFNTVTGLNREWLGEGNHFNEPPEE